MKKGLLVLSVILMFGLIFAAGCETDDDVSIYEDGTYTGVSANANNRGYIEVTITIENDEITEAAIIEYDGMGLAKDYESYGVEGTFDGGDLKEAHETLEARFIENDDWNVDVVTGATSSSDKAMSAVEVAMKKAMVDKPENQYFDGTFMAISDQGARGWGIALVTIENDEITGVELFETAQVRDEDGEPVQGEFELKDEDYGWAEFHEALDYIADSVLEKQTTEGIDAYTEATGSSNMWLQAIERALEAASIQ